MQTDIQKRVGIIRGGTGEEYMSSLQQGGELISHISEHLADKYKVLDILIDRNGIWHINGLPVMPADLVHKVNLAWNTTHPEISLSLSNLAVPHIGNSAFFSALSNSKDMLREHIKSIGINMPRTIILPVYQKDFDGPRERYSIKKAKEVFEKFSSPWIVKSFTPDTNMGIHVAKTFDELAGAIEDGVKHNKSILVEEFIAGKVASTHSIPKFRGEDIYTFPLGQTFGNFSDDEKEELVNLTKNLYIHTAASHYLKFDFVLTPKGKVYLLGIDLHPDLRPNSHFSQVCESVGTKAHHVVEHILERTLK